jgi:hypothetical protein
MGLFSTFEAVEILKRDAQIASLTGENERLRALVETAYFEGYEDGEYEGGGQSRRCWKASNTRAALQPKEGEG